MQRRRAVRRQLRLRVIDTRRFLDQGLQPAADEPATGNGGQVVEFIQQALACQGLQDAKAEGRATDAAARQAHGS